MDRGRDSDRHSAREIYYDVRAPEYDDAYNCTGVWSGAAPRLREETSSLVAAIRSLTPAHTLDVACGTGFLTRYLPGEVVGLDFSARMLGVARAQQRLDVSVRADALSLPFQDDAFPRLFSSHFYGRLEPDERRRFLGESRRVSAELMIVDTPRGSDRPVEGYEERKLLDGSSFMIYKRYFSPEELLGELGGGEVFYVGEWFVGVRVKC